MNKSLKTGLLLILAGIVALAGNLFIKHSLDSQTARDTEPASATVVDYVEDSSYNSTTETYDTVYYPVVSYEADGASIESRYLQSDYEMVYDIGETVDIKYDPDSPEEFYIVGDSSMNTSFMWGIPVGGLLIAVGLGRILVPVVLAKKKQ